MASERRTIKLSLPITVVKSEFLYSLPRIHINPEVIPVIKEEAQLIPFMHEEGIICPVCPRGGIGEFILFGQVHTTTPESRAYLFLCTRCRNVSFLPVTKQGVFKVDYLPSEKRRRTLVEINNPLLAKMSEMRFDFDEFLQGSVDGDYLEVMKKYQNVKEKLGSVSRAKRVPLPPAEVKKK